MYCDVAEVTENECVSKNRGQITERNISYILAEREPRFRIGYGTFGGKLFFYTRLLFSCIDEYEHTYDISTYSVQQ